MDLVKSLIAFLTPKDNKETAVTPAGFCPNCWGREEYGGQFFNRLKQENLDVNSKKSSVGWINAYANKHLMGIALKRKGNGNELICENCKISYQNSNEIGL